MLTEKQVALIQYATFKLQHCIRLDQDSKFMVLDEWDYTAEFFCSRKNWMGDKFIFEIPFKYEIADLMWMLESQASMFFDSQVAA